MLRCNSPFSRNALRVCFLNSSSYDNRQYLHTSTLTFTETKVQIHAKRTVEMYTESQTLHPSSNPLQRTSNYPRMVAFGTYSPSVTQSIRIRGYTLASSATNSILLPSDSKLLSKKHKFMAFFIPHLNMAWTSIPVFPFTNLWTVYIH